MKAAATLAAIALTAAALTGCGESHTCDAAPAPGDTSSIAMALAPMKGGGGGGGGHSSGGKAGGTSSGAKAGTTGSGAKPGTTGSRPGSVGTSSRPGYSYHPGIGRPIPPPRSAPLLRPVTVNHYYYGGYAYGYYMPTPYGGLWPYWVLGASTHEEQDPCT